MMHFNAVMSFSWLANLSITSVPHLECKFIPTPQKIVSPTCLILDGYSRLENKVLILIEYLKDPIWSHLPSDLHVPGLRSITYCLSIKQQTIAWALNDRFGIKTVPNFFEKVNENAKAEMILFPLDLSIYRIISFKFLLFKKKTDTVLCM